MRQSVIVRALNIARQFSFQFSVVPALRLLQMEASNRELHIVDALSESLQFLLLADRSQEPDLRLDVIASLRRPGVAPLLDPRRDGIEHLWYSRQSQLRTQSIRPTAFRKISPHRELTTT